MSDVTQTVRGLGQGNARAAAQWLPLVYDELRKLAAHKLGRERPGQTLQPTALVHEAYLRLVEGAVDSDPKVGRFESRGHFFAAAAEAMRRILIERARRKRSQRRGNGRAIRELRDDNCITLPLDDELLDLDEALTKLESVDAQAAEVVKLRMFAGMTVEETAELQGVSPRTVKRNWAYARAWLARALGQSVR